MKRTISYLVTFFVFVILWQGQASAQVYRSEVRKGNKAFMKKGSYDGAINHYKRALKADSLNIPALYNMAYVLHSDRRDSTKFAEKDSLALNALDKLSETIKGTEHEFDYHFNKGVIYIDMKKWPEAVEAFKQCIILSPGDMKALENYVYAKEHLPKNDQQQQQQRQQQQQQDQQDQQEQQDQQDQQNQQDQQGQQNQQQDQQQDQKDQQNQSNDQQNDSQQDQQNQQNSGQQQDRKQAEKLLQQIQSKERETQDKANKKKAALMQSMQKQKNW